MRQRRRRFATHRLQLGALAVVAVALLTGGNCSRARVESMNHMNQGVAYAQQQRYVDAVEQLEKAAEVDPTNDQAVYNLAQVHMDMRKFNAAKDDLNRAISINGEVAGYHEKLGTVLMQLEDWQSAKTAFEKAVELDDSLFKAHFKLAQVYERLAAQAVEPSELVAQQKQSLQLYTDAIEKGPRFVAAYAALGRMYADVDFPDKATQVLQSGLQVAPEGSDDAANLHHLLGTVYQQQQEHEKAIEHFDAALEINPGLNSALFSLGWTYSLIGNRDEAHRFLKKFVDTAGGEAPSHYVEAARDRLSDLGEGP